MLERDASGAPQNKDVTAKATGAAPGSFHPAHLASATIHAASPQRHWL
jgi:hypothetical protein